MRLIVKFFLVVALTFLSLFIFTGQSFAETKLFKDVCPTNPPSPVCEDAKNTTASNQDNPLSGPNGVIQTAANIVAMITGILAVVMIVISGLMFATAGGNQERTTKARTMLIYSVIGLVIVASAWTVITFVNNNLVNT